MSQNGETSVDTTAIEQRLDEARRYRGFKNVGQLAYFLKLTAESIVEHLRDDARGRILAFHLGVNDDWLWNGRGSMIAREQRAWYIRYEDTDRMPANGPTAFPYGFVYRLALPAPKNYRSQEEQEKLDRIWDPTGFTRALVHLGEIAEDKSQYATARHLYQTTVISAARLGWCLAIDHDHGFVDRDYLKDAVKELRWHDEVGVVQLASSKPPTPRKIIEDYEKAIAVCNQLVERAAADLKIRACELAPKAPSPDWFAARQKGPGRSL